jgi:hypothetical protein
LRKVKLKKISLKLQEIICRLMASGKLFERLTKKEVNLLPPTSYSVTVSGSLIRIFS